MPYMTKIHFSGLILFRTDQSPTRIIIPRVPGDSGSPVGKHVAYIAFRRGKAQPVGWGTPTPFPPSPDEYDWVLLDGETITLSMRGNMLQFGDFLPHLKHKYCPGLDQLKDEYSTGTEAAARVLLQGGDDVGYHVTLRKRIETVVNMSSDQPLELTATKQSTKKYLYFSGEANIIIGNSDEDDLYEVARTPPEPVAAKQTLAHPYDFLFYYLMFKYNTGCNASPADSDADGNPNEKDPVTELPPRGPGVIDIACSNSQYP